MWNQEVGNRELPPDFRNFALKTCIEVAQGSRDIDSASAELQKTWNVALQSFNPTTGLGVEEGATGAMIPGAHLPMGGAPFLRPKSATTL